MRKGVRGLATSAGRLLIRLCLFAGSMQLNINDTIMVEGEQEKLVRLQYAHGCFVASSDVFLCKKDRCPVSGFGNICKTCFQIKYTVTNTNSGSAEVRCAAESLGGVQFLLNDSYSKLLSQRCHQVLCYLFSSWWVVVSAFSFFFFFFWLTRGFSFFACSFHR